MENLTQEKLKFCKFCGERISEDVVICTKCGRQVEALKNKTTDMPNIIINNANTNTNSNHIQNNSGGRPPREKNKWVAFVLCLLFGYIGIHKFYEGKIGIGILYLLTVGLFGSGILVDLIVLLTKPNPYYV